MRMLLPLFLLLLGIGGGVGVGMFLAPAPDPMAAELANPCGDIPAAGDADTANGAAPASAEGEEATGDMGDVAGHEYARMNNQFVVPVVENGRVSALVVLSISVEVVTGTQDMVFENEPKLRDVFLQALFDHANIGGFEGTFTSSSNMRTLRASLRAAARDAVGDQVTDVLIIDIVRQDV